LVIKTKSIYEPVEENDDGIRVLVTRYYPRELSPSRNLLKNYRQGMYNWEEFKTAFMSEIRDNKDSLKRIEDLNVRNEFLVITLLCYEIEGENCHRYIVKDIIENPQLLYVNSVHNDKLKSETNSTTLL
jgi:uncharacterized protein YeaO (DUF488 family)